MYRELTVGNTQHKLGMVSIDASFQFFISPGNFG